MASSWQGVVDQMNTVFTQGSDLIDTGDKFRKKHGKKGDGSDTGTKPYKFGGFAVDHSDRHSKRAIHPRDEAKWLIDSGSRHFDSQSLLDLEDAIIDSLTQQPGNEIPIVFDIHPTPLPPGSKAKAVVVKTSKPYKITIQCAP